jgi:hypothetical protein
MFEQIDDYINSYAPELQAIIRTLREIAKKSMPDSIAHLHKKSGRSA